jgi:conjugative transfer signal peptidase TraF
MKNPWKWSIPGIAIILLILNYSHLFFLNFMTHSMPYGIYIRKGGIPSKGDYAVSCLTPEAADYGIKRGYLVRGNCETGSIEVLKRIEGLPGEQFALKNGILEVGAVKFPVYPNDSQGRPLDLLYKANGGILGKDQYFLISTFAKNSWDSRYWGPVPIKYLVQPFWIFEYGKKT